MGIMTSCATPRRAAWVCMVVGFLTASGCGNAGGSQEASCVTPTIAVSESSSTPGGTVHVTGAHFVATCHDVVKVGESQAPDSPLGALPLLWSDRDHPAVQVAILHPQSDGSVVAVVKLPSTAPQGEGQLFVKDFTVPLNVAIRG